MIRRLDPVSVAFGLLVPNEAVGYVVFRDTTKIGYLSLSACEANVNHFVTRFSINWNHLTKHRQVRAAHMLSLFVSRTTICQGERNAIRRRYGHIAQS